jgi:hypothetical protein
MPTRENPQDLAYFGVLNTSLHPNPGVDSESLCRQACLIDLPLALQDVGGRNDEIHATCQPNLLIQCELKKIRLCSEGVTQRKLPPNFLSQGDRLRLAQMGVTEGVPDEILDFEFLAVQ